MRKDSRYSLRNASVYSNDNDAFDQILAEFREELMILPDYSPRFGEMLGLIKTSLCTAKQFI